MASPIKNKPGELLGLSLSEARVLILGTLCTDDAGKVDCEKLARKGNYKNAASASTSYRTAKRKLNELNPSDGQDAAAGATSSPAKSVLAPKKGKGKGKKDDATPGGGDDVSPSKPKRQKKTPVTPAKLEDSDTEEDNGVANPELSSPTKAGGAKPVKAEPATPVRRESASPMLETQVECAVKSEEGDSGLMVSSDDEWVNKPLDTEAEWNAMEKDKGCVVEPKREA